MNEWLPSRPWLSPVPVLVPRLRCWRPRVAVRFDLLKLAFRYVAAGWTIFLAVLQPSVKTFLVQPRVLAHVASARPYLSHFGQVLAVSAVSGQPLPFLASLRLSDTAANRLVGGDL